MNDMSTEENLHQGHRQRLLKKLFANQELLADHELLEALLFFVIPRVDTNPIAHKLLKVFGSFENIFKASKESLCAIDGVGQKTAELLFIMGNIFMRAEKKKVVKPTLNTPEKLKESLRKDFLGMTKEICTIVFTDNKYKVLCQLSYKNENDYQVSMSLNEIVSSITALQPKYAFIAHNHVADHPLYPSSADDEATKRIYLLCSIHGVNLLDHFVFKGKDGVYSYNDEGRLDMVKNLYEVKEILQGDIKR